MTIFRAQLRALAEAGVVASPTTYRWFGTPTTAVPDALADLPATEHRGYLLATLAEQIYADAYSPGGPRPTPAPGDQLLPSKDRAFARLLGAANGSAGAWEDGWRVVETTDDALGVQSGGLTLWVHPRDVRSFTSRPLTAGDGVALRMPRGSYDLSPGYYSAFSDTSGRTLAESAQIVRLYWALTPAGAAPAMRGITDALNAAGLPYRYKALAAPAHYTRADSAVLYLRTEDLEAAMAALRCVVADLAPYLRATAPLFTLPLAPGLAVAEEPAGSGHSFGQHRSGVVADGLVSAFEQGAADVAGRLGCLVAAVRDAGLDPDAPYVEAAHGDAVDRYRRLAATLAVTPRLTPAATPPVSRATIGGSAGVPAGDPGRIGAGIARQLVRDAVWHADRCTWLSAVAATDEGGRPALAYGGIGSDLYDGGAGVALYLALHAALTGADDVRRTAAAAARQALTAALRSPGSPGLYLGTGGIALAAATTAVLCGDAPMLAQATALATSAASAASAASATGPDLLMGGAGAVLALLALAELCDEPDLVTAAVRTGSEILDAAERGGAGWCWALPSDGAGPRLTGLSHGASGIGAALLELGAATGENRFTVAGLRAFAYERSWYDAARGNWPDLRDAADAEATPTTFLSQWCHGAPGIALARLRAAELVDGEARGQLLEEATTALATTLQTTAEALRTDALSYSLCHGVAGNLSVLWEGRRLLSRADRDALATVEQEFLDGAATVAALGRPWPCGVPAPGVEVPGLMLGTAGIGYHLLERSAPLPLPPVLLPSPTRWAADVHAVAAAALARSESRPIPALTHPES